MPRQLPFPRLRYLLPTVGALVVLLWVLPSSSQPSNIDPLPAGGWSVAARGDGSVLLVKKPSRQAVRKDTSVETLSVKDGVTGVATRAQVAIAGLPRASRIAVGRLGNRILLVSQPGTSPPIYATGSDGEYVLADGGTVWRAKPGFTAVPLVKDSAGGFERAQSTTDAPKYEHGGLIWATDPRPAPSGRFTTYASNREAYQKGAAGQSLWLVDMASGAERALLARDGVSFTALDWAGGELLFTDDAQGGVWAVAPESGQTRRVSSGVLVAVADDGSAMAFLNGTDPARFELEVRRGEETRKIATPSGRELASQGEFSPNGERLVIRLSGQDGRQTLGVVDTATGTLTQIPVPGSPDTFLSDPPSWVDDQRLLVTTTDGRSEQSSLLSVPTTSTPAPKQG